MRVSARSARADALAVEVALAERPRAESTPGSADRVVARRVADLPADDDHVVRPEDGAPLGRGSSTMSRVRRNGR